ncbi:hypothetical protein ACOYR1_03940 [Thalassotalea piscium]
MKQRGIALIQVLLIVAILSILALYLTKTARDQVKIAQWFDDKSTALVNLHSAESELLFSLLTETKTSTSGKIPSKWNFYNKPFNLSPSVQILMQDQAGLLSVHFPDKNLLDKLVGGLSNNKGIKFSDLLLDWQDLDQKPRINGLENSSTRNGKIPHLQDLIHLNNISPAVYKLLQKNMSIYRSGYYNPMNSPIELLRVLTNDEIAQRVVQLRDSKELNKNKFRELTGLKESENMFFYPSNNIAIKIISTIGESRVEKEIVVSLTSYAKLDTTPVLLMYVRG